jgi:hypothetical protein
MNIAFVKGAFIGFAWGHLVAVIGQALLPRYTLGLIDWAVHPFPYDVIYATLPLIPASGILIGGFVGRNYRR